MNFLSVLNFVMMVELTSATAQYNELAILSPTARDIVRVRHLQRIRWVTGPEIKSVNLELCSGPSQNLLVESVIAKSVANSGTFMWNVPYLNTSKIYAIRISDHRNKSIANYSPQFRIYDATYQLNGAISNNNILRETETRTAPTASWKPKATAARVDKTVASIGPLTRIPLSSQRMSLSTILVALSTPATQSPSTFHNSEIGGNAYKKILSSRSSAPLLQPSIAEVRASLTKALLAVSSPTSTAILDVSSHLPSAINTFTHHLTTESANFSSGHIAINSNGARRLETGLIPLASFLIIAIVLY